MNNEDVVRLEKRHVVLSDVYDVSPKQLKKHPDNERLFGRFKTEAQMSELGESIKKFGILEPVIICSDGETILSGHSRVLLAKLQRFESIKARRVLSEHSPEDIVEILAVLNLHRMTLTKKDRLALYAEIYPDFEQRITMYGAKFCTGAPGEVGLNAKVVAANLNLPEPLVKSDLHSIKKAASLRKRSLESWNDTKIHAINRGTLTAVKGYIRKINEWASVSNDQTFTAIVELIAEHHRTLRTQEKARR